MIALLSIPTIAQSQNWRHMLSVNSRIGYSTNTYLNPLFSEWNTGLESGYNLTTVTGQSFWYKNNNSLDITGVLAYEPIFNGQDPWKGGIGLIQYQNRLSSDFSLGVQAGGSRFSSDFSRSTGWVQPSVTWFASPFTLFRLRAGSSFQQYRNSTVTPDTTYRFDNYALEMETWPSYKLQFKAGLYGGLNTLPSIQEGFNTSLSVNYVFNNGARLGLNLGMEQYQVQTASGPGGIPPIGGPGGTATETDRIFRYGLEGSYPLNDRFSLFANTDALHFNSNSTGSSVNDIQVSAGIRFTIQPGRGRKGNKINPGWENENGKYLVEVRYQGEGQLYLVGDFNDWNRPGIPLIKQDGNRYLAELNLQTGAYEYKILLVSGTTEKWLTFSNEVYTVGDGFGGENAMILVE